MLRTTVIAALAGLASAQIAGLSSQCTSALSGIVADPDANACLKPSDLLPIVTSMSASIVPVIDTWSKDICAAAPCSNATLANVVKAIVNGCQAEISGETGGANPDTLASSITPKVQQFYPTVRKVLCLKNGDTMCDTEILQSIQTATGQNLTLNNFITSIASLDFTKIPKNASCSDCVKAGYTILKQDIPDLVSDADPALQSQCGASFTDGNIPSSVSNSAADASPSPDKPNGASTLLSSGPIIIGMTVISTLLSFF